MNGTISLQSKLKGAVSMANTIINGGASPYPKSASGDIITITDGAENTPLKSAVVNSSQCRAEAATLHRPIFAPSAEGRR